ncbi:MAG: cytochrome P450, partial [Ilumatobacteraceae bacterium]
PLFNPFDPKFRANPYPFYDTLRLTEPVHRTALGMVVLTRYEDVSATLKSNDFSRDIEKYSEQSSSPARRRRRERNVGPAKSILNLDPPDHSRLRRLVSKSFTPSAIERLRPRIQQLVDEILDRAQERGSLELVDDLAFPVPFQVISDLLDMPTERVDELRSWSQTITTSLEPTATDAELDATETALESLVPYLTGIIEHRRKHLADDMLSSLITVEEAGERMTTGELMAFVVLLYIAGHETTVNLIGNGTLALIRNPGQLAFARSNGFGAAVVDELLRFDGPVQQTVRVPIVPIHFDVAGDRIEVEPGTIVLTSLGAANHDPAMFDLPNQLQLARPNANRHLAFSAGIHYCLGASLARLETEVAIGSLFNRFAKLEINGEPEWRDRLTIRGVSRLSLSCS